MKKPTMKKQELVTIFLDLSFALHSIVSYINNEHMYSGVKNKEKYSDKIKLKKIKEYILSGDYKVDKVLHKKFTLERMNDKLFSREEVKKGYHLIKRTAPLNKMSDIK